MYDDGGAHGRGRTSRDSGGAGCDGPAQDKGDVVTLRAVRGATQIDVDEAEHLLERTAELMRAVLKRNDLTSADLVSVFLTATPDVRSAFPAAAVRGLGMTDVPLMCAQEMDVPGAMPRVIRLMAHVDTPRPREAIHHVYLHGTTVLRDDLTGDTSATDDEDGRR